MEPTEESSSLKRLFLPPKGFRNRLMPVHADQKPDREMPGRIIWNLFFSILFFLFILWAIFKSESSQQSEGWFILAFPALLVLIGIFLLAQRSGKWASDRDAGWADVYVDYFPLHVDKPFRMEYSRKSKRPVEIRGLSVTLIMREKAESGSGTNLRTVYHDIPVAEYSIPPEEFRAEEGLAFSKQMEIPRNAMHSFFAMHNWIYWLVRVKADVPGRPDFQEDFELRVVPYLKR
jgi:hypothetical protein